MALFATPLQKSTESRDLLGRIVFKDQAALGALYDRHARLLFSVAFKILASTEEAEEAILDVFSQVWKTAASYDPTKASVEGWLLMMTRSRALDRVRALKRVAKVEQASEEAAALGLPSAPDPEEHALQSERSHAVRQALAALPETQRQVLELAYYKGLSHSEIASQTGEPLGTVKTRIRSGLGKLRDALSHGWKDPE